MVTSTCLRPPPLTTDLLQSVPPVWASIQKCWDWMDNELQEQAFDEDQPIKERQPWWEEMVDRVVKDSGVLSLV